MCVSDGKVSGQGTESFSVGPLAELPPHKGI